MLMVAEMQVKAYSIGAEDVYNLLSQCTWASATYISSTLLCIFMADVFPLSDTGKLCQLKLALHGGLCSRNPVAVLQPAQDCRPPVCRPFILKGLQTAGLP